MAPWPLHRKTTSCLSEELLQGRRLLRDAFPGRRSSRRGWGKGNPGHQALGKGADCLNRAGSHDRAFPDGKGVRSPRSPACHPTRLPRCLFGRGLSSSGGWWGGVELNAHLPRLWAGGFLFLQMLGTAALSLRTAVASCCPLASRPGAASRD